jgi:tryptophan halogenase
MKINSIVIVGGGSSGWFTASTLNKHCPEINVTLIESPDVPTIGVGESTVGNINQLFQTLNLKDKDWMSQCDATYKATIKFTDFYKEGEIFHYPFGSQDLKHTTDIGGVDSWVFKKYLYPEIPQTDFAESFWPVMQMVNKNKIHSNEDNVIPNFNMQNHWSYQLDATKLGNWMKTNLCSDTKHILDHVTDIDLNEFGWISSLSTKEHGELKADLYIDCTGFSSVLLGKSLEVPYTSYKDMLINNGAWVTRVPYVDQNVEMELSTDGVAIGNGWVWNIPLWNSISKGYVHSDKFVDKEFALKEYKEYLKRTNQWCKNNDVEELEFRYVDIKNGIHEKVWHKNCIAIGLSYGFLEPLESTGLLLTIEQIQKLIIVLQSRDGYVNQFDRDSVNKETQRDFEGQQKFIEYHFTGSIRDDTEYWKWYTQELEFEWEIISKSRFRNITFNNFFVGLQCIAIGNHINLYTDYTTKLPLIGAHLKECIESGIDQTFEYWKERNKKISLLADKSPTHYEYLKEKIYN